MFRCRIHGVSLARIIVILVVLLILLQLLHMSLLSKLEAKGTVYKHGRFLDRRQKEEKHSKYTWHRMRTKLENTHVLDQSGQYQVLDNFVKAGDTEDSNIISDVKDKLQYFNVDTNGYDITMVTQSSARNLHQLVELSRAWQGPISVAVFAFGNDFSNFLKTIAYLHLCNENIKERVSFHLVYPLDHPPENLNFSENSKGELCDESLDNFFSKKEENYANKVKYPHNLLRNLAVKYTTSSYVMVIDIDILPSRSLYGDFNNFIQKYVSRNTSQTDSTAFVLPVFEVKADSIIPETKGELLAAWEGGKARPFYYEVCWKCQRHTDYDRWKSLRPVPGSPLQVSYYQPWRDPWEPFYIAKRNLPMYDERFKQYGFNRISQVCELHTSGFVFAVLDSAFLVHRGFKYPNVFHPTKEQEQKENRILFRKFKEELKTKYPESDRSC